MKLTILGTGNALVTECYNTCFVLSEGEKHFMVDAGGGNTVCVSSSRQELMSIPFTICF